MCIWWWRGSRCVNASAHDLRLELEAALGIPFAMSTRFTSERSPGELGLLFHPCFDVEASITCRSGC
jgi:hypothetical protein